MPEFLGEDDRYRLVRFVAEDWLGQIWQGQDLTARSELTIRIVRQPLVADPVLRDAFYAQLSSLQVCLAHPNIARIRGFSDDRAEPVDFVVMEETQGQTIGQRLRRGPSVRSEEAYTICAAVGEGLRAAHQLAVVHEALTGHSVMLNDDGSVLVMDFGLGTLQPGTYPWPPAEGPAGDVYALASLLREMLGSTATLGLAEGQALTAVWEASLDPNPAARPTVDVLVSALRDAAREQPAPPADHISVAPL